MAKSSHFEMAAMFDSLFDYVRRMDKRQFLYQVLSFGMTVSSVLMISKGLMVVTGSESPIVVVLSGSVQTTETIFLFSLK